MVQHGCRKGARSQSASELHNPNRVAARQCVPSEVLAGWTKHLFHEFSGGGARVLKRIELDNFKAFERLSAAFGKSTFVVGPNNAGKSTLLSALRLASGLLRQASRVGPDRTGMYKANQYLGYGFDSERLGLVEENLRHEFRDVETSIHLVFDGGARLRSVWPAGLDEDDRPASPFFFVEVDNRPQPRTPAVVRAAFPTIGVVPMLAPIERTETVLDPKTVKRDLGGRLSSRHFRNELHLLPENEFEQYRQLVRRRAPKIELRSLDLRMAPGGMQLDLFYEDEGHRVPKEICWAGDGLQVWLQVLYQINRLRDVDVLILDEPDIYLHADLQRRLVQILEELDAQTILASHSPEVLGEAHTENVLWVDKSRRRAVRGSDGLTFSADAIGSQFNVRIARALRSSVALFVEGKDMKIIRNLARTSGADRIADETGLAVVPLDGFSNRTNVTPFKILVDEFLEGSVKSFVILDRDYRSEATCRSIVAEFDSIGIGCHIWGRKEIESYLLVPSALASERPWAGRRRLHPWRRRRVIPRQGLRPVAGGGRGGAGRADHTSGDDHRGLRTQVRRGLGGPGAAAWTRSAEGGHESVQRRGGRARWPACFCGEARQGSSRGRDRS